MTGRIVVGVDGSAHAQHALDVAIEEARLRDAHLVVAMAWSMPAVYPGLEYAVGGILKSELQASAEKELEDILADAPGDVVIERVVSMGSPPHMLTRLAEDADLLVVGSRGRGGFKGLLLGSTSHAVLGRASCPVLVVPAVAS